MSTCHTCTSHIGLLTPQVGSQRQFGFTPKDHVTLGEALGLLDFESAAEVSLSLSGN
jgi:seryl-tRNA synthetase